MSNTRHGEPYLRIVLAGFLLLLISGCTSVAPAPNRQRLLSRWQHERHEHPYHGDNTVFVGIAVTEFAWYRNQLYSWGRSRDLLAQAFQTWLNLGPDQIIQQDNPGRIEIERLFTDQLAGMQPDQQIIIYLGTHYLQDGRILLARGESITAAELSEWMSGLPGTQLLLADVCYANVMEAQADFPTATSRIYAASASEPTPDVRLTGSHSIPGIREYFQATHDLLRGDLARAEDQYSLMGLCLVHSLVELLRSRPAVISSTSLFTQLQKTYLELDQASRTFRPPKPQAAQLNTRPIANLRATDSPWYARFQKSVLDENLPLTMNHALLDIGRIYDPTLVTMGYAQQLERMADTLKRRTAGLTRTSEIIEQTERYLFDELKIRAIDKAYTEDFLLHKVLAERRGRCASLTALFLALAERLDWPLSAVCIPEHIFVRWQQTDDQPHINLETTDRARERSDESYRNRRPLPDTEASRHFYFQPLSKRQAIATYLSPLGNALRLQGRLTDARRVLELSIAINPQDVEAWNNLGLVLVRSNEADAARSAYDEALRIAPNFAAAWNNLGNLDGPLDIRLRAYQQAVTHDPGLGTAWAQLSQIWLQKGNLAKAWVCAKRSGESGFQIDPDYIKWLREQLNDQE